MRENGKNSIILILPRSIIRPLEFKLVELTFYLLVTSQPASLLRWQRGRRRRLRLNLIPSVLHRLPSSSSLSGSLASFTHFTPMMDIMTRRQFNISPWPAILVSILINLHFKLERRKFLFVSRNCHPSSSLTHFRSSEWARGEKRRRSRISIVAIFIFT